MSGRTRLLVSVLLLAGLPSAAPAAPAETPPAEFAADRYVDSRGCVFRRAEISGRVLWAELRGPGGQPVCGAEPSLPPPGLSDALPPIPPNRRGTAPDFPAPGAYVQVGAFRDTANADAVADSLRVAGLPGLRQDFRRAGGGLLRVLYAGPLEPGTPAQEALRAVRGMGFGDAFLWLQD